MRIRFAAFVGCCVAWVTTASASEAPIVYSHCLNWTADDAVCFLELLKEDDGAYLLVTSERFDRVLSIPWAGMTQATVEVVSQSEYDTNESTAVRSYSYDLSASSSQIAFTVTFANNSVGAETSVLIATSDAVVTEVVLEQNSRESGGVLGVQIEHNDQARLHGHSPDASRCQRDILLGALKGAGGWARIGSSAGSLIPSPVPGGGNLAGGVLGGSVGFVVGAVLAGHTSPYCPHTHDDDEGNSENDSNSEDGGQGTSDGGTGDAGAPGENQGGGVDGDTGAGKDEDEDSDDGDDDESEDSVGDTEDAEDAEEVTPEEGTTVDPGASCSEFRPHPFQWTGSKDGVIILADTLIASYVIERGELHGDDGVVDDDEDGEGSEEVDEPKQLKIDESYFVVDPI